MLIRLLTDQELVFHKLEDKHSMKLRDYNCVGRYFLLDTKELVESKENTDDYQGFFQDHTLGRIVYCFDPNPFLQIQDKIFDLDKIKLVKYISSGNFREVELIGFEEELIDTFKYEVFWIDDADILEVAFGLPDDDERDIMKHIANAINRKSKF